MTGFRKKYINQEEIFEVIYKLYHTKGLTSTAVKLLDEFGLYEGWKEYIKKEDDFHEAAKKESNKSGAFNKITLF